jgi:hypothetical protein
MRIQVESAIKQEIEHVFGRRIVSSRDCVQLSHEIFYRTKVQLNPNTLRRLFGLVKTAHSPSNSTLTILSQYCGFHSIDEINTLQKVEDSDGNNNFLHFLVSLFRNVQVKDSEDNTFLGIAQNTVDFLNRNPSMRDRFQIQIAKTKNGQEFYFEKFVNIDKLDGYYGNGLRYYYSEKPDAGRVQVFAHSLLVFRFWLTGNCEMLEQHFTILSGQCFNALIPPFIYGRYLAAMIYNADIHSQCTKKILQNAYNYYSSVSKDQAKSSFPRFELYLAEALILTGHFEEGQYYIAEAKKNYSEKDDYTNWKFFQNFLLLETIALCKTGQYAAASERFSKIDPTQFYFLRKSYCNILYLLLTEQLKKKQSLKHDEQLNDLIQDTGFCHLKEIYRARYK